MTREDHRIAKASQTPPQHPGAKQDAARANDEGTALTLEERRAMLRNEFSQEALPPAPDIPGYHCCWLTTSSTYDPLHKRLRLGYELVKAEDLRGFQHFKTASGEYAGFVMCNEMILAKVPNEIYQMIMAEFHHHRPLQEEESIRAQVEQLEGQQKDRKGNSLTSREEGMEDENLVLERPVPVFPT